MSTHGNGSGRKRKLKPRHPRLVPLLMLGSDGETYACSPAVMIPPGVLKNPGVIVAVRLLPRERDIALNCLQSGVLEATRTLAGILGRKFDA
jgi:hypothetical protein